MRRSWITSLLDKVSWDHSQALERALEGVQAETVSVTQAVTLFYICQSVDSPGIQPQDFGRVLVPASA